MTRVVVHTADPEPIVTQLSREFQGGDVHFAACDSYAALPGLIAEVRPEVVYSVRFAGNSGFPRAALLGLTGQRGQTGQTGQTGPRWIAVGGSGCDHLVPWNPERVTVTNGAGTASFMMAEYILGCFLHFTLDIAGLEQDRQSRRWRADRLVRPLAGSTLLIVGLGNTGQATAARAKALGMRVVGTRSRPSSSASLGSVDRVGGPDDLLKLAAEADFVAVSCPLTGATLGLLGEAFFSALKPGAVLANVSRGGVVDEVALSAALTSGRLAGAAMDVFAAEPLPADDPIWSVPNLLISPHCSAVFASWEAESARFFGENLSRYLAGEPLINVVSA